MFKKVSTTRYDLFLDECVIYTSPLYGKALLLVSLTNSILNQTRYLLHSDVTNQMKLQADNCHLKHYLFSLKR